METLIFCAVWMINGFPQNVTLPVPNPDKGRTFLKPFELPKTSVKTKTYVFLIHYNFLKCTARQEGLKQYAENIHDRGLLKL